MEGRNREVRRYFRLVIFRNRGWSKCGDYGAKDYYEKDTVTKEAVDFIIGDELKSMGDDREHCKGRIFLVRSYA